MNERKIFVKQCANVGVCPLISSSLSFFASFHLSKDIHDSQVQILRSTHYNSINDPGSNSDSANSLVLRFLLFFSFLTPLFFFKKMLNFFLSFFLYFDCSFHADISFDIYEPEY